VNREQPVPKKDEPLGSLSGWRIRVERVRVGGIESEVWELPASSPKARSRRRLRRWARRVTLAALESFLTDGSVDAF